MTMGIFTVDLSSESPVPGNGLKFDFEEGNSHRQKEAHVGIPIEGSQPIDLTVCE